MEEEKATYTMVASGPAVPAEEVERAEQAVEVVVMWGDQALHVAHLAPPRPFVIGERRIDGSATDWLVGAETLGAESLPIVLDGGAGPVVVIPDGASLSVTIDGATRNLAALEVAGLLTPCAELAGARQYALPATASARIEHRGLTFIVRAGAAGKSIGTSLQAMLMAADPTHLKYIGGALVFVAALLCLMQLLPPAGAGLSIDALSATSRIVDYLETAPETMDEEEAVWLDESGPTGGDGQRAAEAEGQMGDESSPVTHRRSAIPGPADNTDRRMANRAAQEEAARNVETIGVIAQMAGAWNQPTSPFGAATALGSDPTAALGSLLADQIGNDFGRYGLGMRGTGRGAGGDGRGTYGLGRLGTIGDGAGCDTEHCTSGYGRNVGLGAHRESHVPGPITSGPVDVAGSLSREVIRRVVARHHNEVRYCYEQALRNEPDMEGRVTVSWVIQGNGAVMSSVVVPSRTNMSGGDVPGCVAQAVRRWTFPAPENGGVVSVTYPFLFSTAD